MTYEQRCAQLVIARSKKQSWNQGGRPRNKFYNAIEQVSKFGTVKMVFRSPAEAKGLYQGIAASRRNLRIKLRGNVLWFSLRGKVVKVEAK